VLARVALVSSSGSPCRLLSVLLGKSGHSRQQRVTVQASIERKHAHYFSVGFFYFLTVLAVLSIGVCVYELSVVCVCDCVSVRARALVACAQRSNERESARARASERARVSVFVREKGIPCRAGHGIRLTERAHAYAIYICLYIYIVYTCSAVYLFKNTIITI